MPQDEPNIIVEMEPQKDIILMTSFPEATSPSRRAEYNECLEINCNSAISKVVVFFEGSAEGAEFFPALQHDKVEVVYINERPMYSMFIDYANNHFSGDCVVVSNGDIFFDKGSNIERALEIESGHAWALARHELDSARKEWIPIGALSSYDSYIFIPPVKISGYDIVVGILGCDTYLVQKMIRNGLILGNPALSLTSKHKHDAGGRRVFLVVGSKKWHRHNPITPATAKDELVAGTKRWSYWNAPQGEGQIFARLKLTWQYLFHGIEFGFPEKSHIENCKTISRKRFPDHLRPYLKRYVIPFPKTYILGGFRKLKRLTRRPNSS